MNMYSKYLEATKAASDAREACYKMAAERFNAGDKQGQKDAYAMADKWQAVLDQMLPLDPLLAGDVKGAPGDWGDDE